MAITREWDGKSYDRISGPMEIMGLEVLDRLTLRGDETVMDAGCGSGRITAALLDRLPRGHVLAVDGSAAMLDAARERLGTDPRVDYIQADLTDLDLNGQQCDAILSTATFHWVPDHSAMARSLYRHLRPGGALVAQCGGAGNIQAVHDAAAQAALEAPFAEYMAGWTGPWNFRDPAAMRDDLLAAGFEDVVCTLAPRPVVPDDPAAWFRTIVLGSHVQQLPENLRDAFVDATLRRIPKPVTVDYVRLNIDASIPE